MERAWPVDSKWAVRAMEDWSGCGLGWVEAAMDCFRGFAGDYGGQGIGSRDSLRVARIGGKFGGQIRELAGARFLDSRPFAGLPLESPAHGWALGEGLEA